MTEPVFDLGQAGEGLRGVAQEKGAPVEACYQCLRCSAGCPMLSFMDIAPHRVIRMVQCGVVDEVLASRTIWMCASCQTCTTRCPNEVEIAHLMDVLRQESLRRKVACPHPEVEQFHRAFVREIRRGRVHELSLIGRYKLATRRFTDDVALGTEMFKRGRIKLLPRRGGDRGTVRRLFDLAEKNR